MKSNKKYNYYNKILILLSIISIVLIVVSICIGQFNVPLIQTIKIIINQFLKFVSKLFSTSNKFLLNKTWNDAMYNVVINIRFPRVILAFVIGCGLSVAGCSFQGIFSNNMASPDILGASSGAGFGACLGLLFGMSQSMSISLGFVFSLVSIILVFFISKISKGFKLTNLILTGIMVGSIFSSGISLIKLVADPNDKLPKITYWLMGSFGGSGFKEMIFGLIILVIGLIPILLLRFKLNILTLPEDEAKSLGVNVNIVRIVIIICATLITAMSVCVAGMIGFIGLVVPNLSRKLVGDDYQKLLMTSCLMGGIFLLLVDDVSRTLLLTEIPIGIITSLIGAPFFLYLILRKHSKV